MIEMDILEHTFSWVESKEHGLMQIKQSGPSDQSVKSLKTQKGGLIDYIFQTWSTSDSTHASASSCAQTGHPFWGSVQFQEVSLATAQLGQFQMGQI